MQTNKNTNKDSKTEWLPIKDAVRLSGLKTGHIHTLAYNKIVRKKKQENSYKCLYCLQDIIEYRDKQAQKRLKKNKEKAEQVQRRSWGNIVPRDGEHFYIAQGYDDKLLVSNYGRVINASTGKELAQTLIDQTYYYVRTSIQNQAHCESVHKLVVDTQVDNNLLKTMTHHIDGNKHNNKKENLLPVWDKEHKSLHKLMDIDTPLADNKEYYDMVAKIQSDNSQPIYIIHHPDYDKDSDMYLGLTPRGYDLYKSGALCKLEDVKEILWERCDPNLKYRREIKE